MNDSPGFIGRQENQNKYVGRNIGAESLTAATLAHGRAAPNPPSFQ